MLRAPQFWVVLLVLLVIAGGAYALTRGGEDPAGSLVVEVRSHEGAVPVVREIRCDDAGMGAVCAALTPELLRPVPKDKACTMIYGGPQTATVTGTLRGKSVRSGFSRTDGCEIARWNELAKALEPLGIQGLDN